MSLTLSSFCFPILVTKNYFVCVGYDIRWRVSINLISWQKLHMEHALMSLRCRWLAIFLVCFRRSSATASLLGEAATLFVEFFHSFPDFLNYSWLCALFLVDRVGCGSDVGLHKVNYYCFGFPVEAPWINKTRRVSRKYLILYSFDNKCMSHL